MAAITCPSVGKFKEPAIGKALQLKVEIRADNHLNDAIKRKKKTCLHAINNDAWITCIKY